MAPPEPRPLSEHEKRIVTLVADGLTNAEIGTRLFRSGETIKSSLDVIGKILGIRCRAGIVAACLRSGVIS